MDGGAGEMREWGPEWQPISRERWYLPRTPHGGPDHSPALRMTGLHSLLDLHGHLKPRHADSAGADIRFWPQDADHWATYHQTDKNNEELTKRQQYSFVGFFFFLNISSFTEDKTESTDSDWKLKITLCIYLR